MILEIINLHSYLRINLSSNLYNNLRTYLQSNVSTILCSYNTKQGDLLEEKFDHVIDTNLPPNLRIS